MKTLVVFAHPWHGSFNFSILETVKKELSNQEKEFDIIDLNKDKFNPVLDEENLALFSKGKSKDSLVHQYQEKIMRSNRIIFIFPIWWGGPPAILKGFIDKVMLKDFAYSQEKFGLKGKLTHLHETILITTSEAPTFIIRTILGNPIKKIVIKLILKTIGIKKNKWINCGQTTSGSLAKRVAFLEKIRKSI